MIFDCLFFPFFKNPSTFNYWNDRFFNLWWTQLFFTLTELFITILAYSLIDRRSPHNQNTNYNLLCLWTILSVETMHIFEAFSDNAISNFSDPRRHLFARDIGLFVCDLGVAVACMYPIYRHYFRQNDSDLSNGNARLFSSHCCWAFAGCFSLVIFFQFFKLLSDI